MALLKITQNLYQPHSGAHYRQKETFAQWLFFYFTAVTSLVASQEQQILLALVHKVQVCQDTQECRPAEYTYGCYAARRQDFAVLA